MQRIIRKRAVLSVLFFLVAFLASAQSSIRNFKQQGIATATFYSDGLCIAHPTLAIGIYVKVTNMETNRVVYATVTNRIDASVYRIVDLSPSVARAIGVPTNGSALVLLERATPLVEPEPEPEPEPGYFREDGIASWYGTVFTGHPTASGEPFNPGQLTAAHPSLPFGTLVRVTNIYNGRQVVVRINDRGPFVNTRIIDVSRAAAEVLDMISTGTAPVILEIVR